MTPSRPLFRLSLLPLLAAVTLLWLGDAGPALACDPAADACCPDTPAASEADSQGDDDPCPGDCDHCTLPCCAGSAFAKLAPASLSTTPCSHEARLSERREMPVRSHLAARELDHPPRA